MAPRPRRSKDQTGDVLTGQGIAYAQRNGTRVAIIARSKSTARRQDLGAAVHRRARLRPDHHPRPPAEVIEGKSCRAPAARSTKK